MKRLIITLIVVACYTSVGISQQVAKSTYGKTILKNATVHTVTNGILENTDVLIDNGKIEEVGSNLNASDAQVIDCSDRL